MTVKWDHERKTMYPQDVHNNSGQFRLRFQADALLIVCLFVTASLLAVDSIPRGSIHLVVCFKNESQHWTPGRFFFKMRSRLNRYSRGQSPNSGWTGKQLLVENNILPVDNSLPYSYISNFKKFEDMAFQRNKLFILSRKLFIQNQEVTRWTAR